MLKKISKTVIDEVRLLHKNKNRQERNLFIAEGPKVVGELLNSGLKIKFIAGTPEILEPMEQNYPGLEFYTVSDKDLERISTLTTPNKIIAVAEIPIVNKTFEDIKNQNIIVLDGINDPGNMGTIIRTAEWFGVNQIVCSPDSVDCWNPKVVQGAMGSLFRMTVRYGDLSEFIHEVTEKNSHLVMGAALDGDELSLINLKMPFVLIIGSESHGIRTPLNSMLPLKVSIPGAGGAVTESLNAAVACGILLYDLSCKKNARLMKPGIEVDIRK